MYDGAQIASMLKMLNFPYTALNEGGKTLSTMQRRMTEMRMAPGPSREISRESKAASIRITGTAA